MESFGKSLKDFDDVYRKIAEYEQKDKMKQHIEYATKRSIAKINSLMERVIKITNDVDSEKRLENRYCLACHYFDRIGGAAMTTRSCMSCGVDVVYGSTNTDALCMECAVKHKLCKHCGGDIDLKVQEEQPKTEHFHKPASPEDQLIYEGIAKRYHDGIKRQLKDLDENFEKSFNDGPKIITEKELKKSQIRELNRQLKEKFGDPDEV